MMINNKYKILEQIGAGSFGKIYRGQNIRTNEYVAIKIEPIQSQFKIGANFKTLKYETNVYLYLAGNKGVPKVKWFGMEPNKFYYMVMDLLGPSLKDVVNLAKLPDIINIGIQLIEILKNIHNKGLIHRDVKPDNFLFNPSTINDINNPEKSTSTTIFGEHKTHSKSQTLSELYIVDFGLCKRYVDNEGNHNKQCNTTALIGSKNYSSLNAHYLCEQSRRDDLESVCYVLIYLIYGELPWKNDQNEIDIINKKKAIAEITLTGLGGKVISLLNYIRKLDYASKPDYEHLMFILRG